MMISDDDLRAAIENELDELARDAASRGEGDSPDWQPEIDSHAVLSVILRVEEETGVTISESVIPVGGFADRETCVREMMAHAKAAIAASAKEPSQQEVH